MTGRMEIEGKQRHLVVEVREEESCHTGNNEERQWRRSSDAEANSNGCEDCRSGGGRVGPM